MVCTLVMLSSQLKKEGEQRLVVCSRSTLLCNATASTSEKRICECYFSNEEYSSKIYGKIEIPNGLKFNTFLSNSHVRLHGGPSQSTFLDALCFGYQQSCAMGTCQAIGKHTPGSKCGQAYSLRWRSCKLPHFYISLQVK